MTDQYTGHGNNYSGKCWIGDYWHELLHQLFSRNLFCFTNICYDQCSCYNPQSTGLYVRCCGEIKDDSILVWYYHVMLWKDTFKICLKKQTPKRSAVSDLNSGAGVEHDVFDGALNVLRPRHQPCDFVVMTNFLPPGAWGWFGVNWISEDNKQWVTVILIL